MKIPFWALWCEHQESRDSAKQVVPTSDGGDSDHDPRQQGTLNSTCIPLSHLQIPSPVATVVWEPQAPQQSPEVILPSSAQLELPPFVHLLF